MLATSGIEYYYLASQPLVVRVGLGLLCFLGAGFVAFRTGLGKKAWHTWQEAWQETLRIVWPTKQETIQTTLAVFVMVLVMGLFLWSTDALLLKLIAWLTAH